jgi:diacylglycerol O-acyltransferase / wax synthase
VSVTQQRRGHVEPGAVTRVPVPDLCCLWAETDTTPMNIALVGTLDAGPLVDDRGAVVIDRVRGAVEARLDRAPMLRRVLRRTLPGQGRPVWIDAPEVAMDRHVVVADRARPFPDEQAFLDWCAQETLRPLDRSRPLWRLTLVPGLPHERVGLLVVVHHVVADGLRGVAMIAGLLDDTPHGTGSPSAPWHPAPPPTGAALVGDNLRARSATVRSLRRARVRRHLAELRALRTEAGARATATRLTGAIGPRRRLVVVREPLEDVRAVAHGVGGTINDLLLAGVTQGLRDMLWPRGDCGETTVLRASVPVGETGHRAGGMMTVDLPVGTADPRERLARIVAETSQRKESPVGGVAGIVSMPAGLAHLGVLWARHAAATHINLYVTNVPGPPRPLFLAGARLQDVVPLAPLVAGVRLSVTALSYDGTLSVALLADENLTDVPVLASGTRSVLQGRAPGAA